MHFHLTFTTQDFDEESGSPKGSTTEIVATLTRERDDYYDRLLRMTAEFDNYRKRVERDRTVARDTAIGDVLSGLLPVLDDLQRPRHPARAKLATKAWSGNSRPSASAANFFIALSTASTATPPAFLSSPRRALPHPNWRPLFATARAGRSIGRWLPACHARPRGAFPPGWLRRAARTESGCGSPNMETVTPITRSASTRLSTMPVSSPLG